MKYLFLDYDDTLNLPTGDDNSINQVPLDNLKYLINAHDPKIIVSASMKIHGLDHVQNVFSGYGIHVHDITPSLQAETFSIPRGLEIRQWFINNNIPFMPVYDSKGLRVFKPNAIFCIVDDDGDMLLEQRDNFVQVHPEKGLDNVAAIQVEKILSNK